MSNEKPKPIIIKSNKCEDTLPSPITKETDWDDTKELTNQELKTYPYLLSRIILIYLSSY